MSEKEKLIASLEVLHSANSSENPQQFQKANKFLMEFTKQNKAWIPCLEILKDFRSMDNPNIVIIAFAARTLHSSLPGNVVELSQQPTHINHILQILQPFIGDFAKRYFNDYLQKKCVEFKFIFGKVAQTLALLSLASKQSMGLISSILTKMKGFKAQSNQFTMEVLIALWSDIEMLNSFAIEFNEPHVSLRIISDTKTELKNQCLQPMLKFFQFAMAIAFQHSQNANKSQSDRPMSVAVPMSLPIESNALISAALECTHHWLPILDCSELILSEIGILDEIFKLLPHLFSVQSGDHRTRQFLIDTLLYITNPLKQPNYTGKRHLIERQQRVLDKMSDALAHLGTPLQAAIDVNNKEIIRGIAHLICGFSEHKTALIARGSQSCLKIVKMILQCTSHRATIISEITFDFWMQLQDIPMQQRHVQLRNNVYSQLLHAMLSHAADPEEFDTHSRFRRFSADLFVSIFCVLNEGFFTHITQQLQEHFKTLKENRERLKPEMLVRIESCFFALTMIAETIENGVSDIESYRQYCTKYIRQLCLDIFSMPLHQLPMSATTLHLLESIAQFIRTYTFYIHNDMQLLKQSLQYLVDLACKHQPLLAKPCSDAFQTLVNRSNKVFLAELDNFETVARFVFDSMGCGDKLYLKIPPKEIALLADSIICDISEDDYSDPTALDVIQRQQIACAEFYGSVCRITDQYTDAQRQSKIINNLIGPFLSEATNIVTNLKNKSTENPFTVVTFYRFTTDLHVFSGIIKALPTMPTTHKHALRPHINTLLQLCHESAEVISPLLSNNQSSSPQRYNRRRDNSLPTNLSEIDSSILFSNICNVLESILDIFGQSTVDIIKPLVDVILKLLKRTKSEASARILRKMVNTFATNSQVWKNFFELVKGAVQHFSNNQSGDIREFPETVVEIVNCVDIIMKEYALDPDFQNDLLPKSLQLCLEIIDKIGDRKILKQTFQFLSNVFAKKNAMRRISKQLQLNLAPTLITTIFKGIEESFERSVVMAASAVLYNMMQWDTEFTQSKLKALVMECRAAQLQKNLETGEDFKPILIRAFWAQRTNPRKFDLLILDLYTVCHSQNTPDCFASHLE